MKTSHLIGAAVIALTAAPHISLAADIIAAQQPGATDSERLQYAIDRAQPGDTVYLSACSDQGDGEVSCPQPLTWEVDGTIRGKQGLTYDGSSKLGRSTIRLADNDGGQAWKSVREKRALDFQGRALPQPTIIRDVRFDGNRRGQRYDASQPGPKQELLRLSSSSGEQEFKVSNCEIESALGAGLVAHNGAMVEVEGLRTANNATALQLAGRKGAMKLYVSNWLSREDGMAYRGIIEGDLLPGAQVYAHIENAKIIDATQYAFSFGPGRAGQGRGSRFVAQNVTTDCSEARACMAGAILNARQAEVLIEDASIGGGNAKRPGASIAMEDVEGEIIVRRAALGGYVHIQAAHGSRLEKRIRLEDVTVSGSADAAQAGLMSDLPSGMERFAIFSSQYTNLKGAELRVELADVRVDALMRADALLHLYGGEAQIDGQTLSANTLPVAVSGAKRRAIVSRVAYQPGIGAPYWTAKTFASGTAVYIP